MIDSYMTLDLIIPTFNRHESLRSALVSILRAHVPPTLDVSVIVVDNNCTDGTPATIASFESAFGGKLRTVRETQQGRSNALNAGIKASGGDLVGFIDDDEEIDPTWFSVVSETFAVPELDFAGGPYIPKWEVPQPEWLPARYSGVLGIIDGGSKRRPYDRNFPGILMGGNAVYRRTVFEKLGLFHPDLGRRGNKLTAEEDADMYERLLAAGMRGLYIPELVIYHRIPADRVTKRYFRRWCFWNGVSLSQTDRVRREQVTRVFGIPRYLVREGLYGAVPFLLPLRDSQRFSTELPFWTLLGFVYGHFRPNAHK